VHSEREKISAAGTQSMHKKGQGTVLYTTLMNLEGARNLASRGEGFIGGSDRSHGRTE
jgi:hypothetical protein